MLFLCSQEHKNKESEQKPVEVRLQQTTLVKK